MPPQTASTQTIGFLRIIIGLLQGLALYLIKEALQSSHWLAADRDLLRALTAVVLFVPTIAIVSMGNLQRRSLAAWCLASTLLCAALGFYSSYRNASSPPNFPLSHFYELTAVSGFACLLFVLQALIASGDSDRKPIASFATYFDTTWKLGAQIVLAWLFVGVFWAVLWLGATLFEQINLKFFSELLKRDWFYVPATTVAAGAALHLTDARAGLVRGARTLTLSMLSWLLPIMTLIAVGFLCALPFTGLQPLWSTRHATLSLIAASIFLIVLINSHYQDGGPGTASPRVLAYSRTLAAVVLVPLTVIAVIGLNLRVQQYGWTPSRVTAAAALVAIGCHAVGYTMAALRSGPRLALLPATNVMSAFVMVAIMLALLSPFGDPARIAVSSQVARLEAGLVPVDKFDFNFLRFNGVRYGRTALEKLKEKTEGANAREIAAKAVEALKSENRYASRPKTDATPASRVADIEVVLPAGATLPQAFVAKDWSTTPPAPAVPACLREAESRQRCQAMIVDLDDDGRPEIVIIDGVQVVVFATAADGQWANIGRYQGNIYCSGATSALRAGNVQFVQPKFKSIDADGQVLSFVPPCAPARR